MLGRDLPTPAFVSSLGCYIYYKLHRKKKVSDIPVPTWMSLTKLSLGGNGNFANLFYSVSSVTLTVPDSLEFVDGHSHVVVECVLEGNLHALLHLHAVKGIGQRYSLVYYSYRTYWIIAHDAL